MFGMSTAGPVDDDDDLGGGIVEIGKRLLDDGAHDALLDLGDAGQRPVPTSLQLTRHETVLGISGIMLPKDPVSGVACCLEVADQRFPGFVTSR